MDCLPGPPPMPYIYIGGGYTKRTIHTQTHSLVPPADLLYGQPVTRFFANTPLTWEKAHALRQRDQVLIPIAIRVSFQRAELAHLPWG